MKIFESSFASNFVTLATSSSAVVSTSILLCIFMTMDAMCLLRFSSHKIISSKNIFFLSHNLEMRRFYTQFIFTNVIQDHSIRNRPFFNLVTNSISFFNFIFSPGNMKRAITLTICTCRPHPTCFSFFYLLPKVFHRTMNNAICVGGKL